ncbi:NAD(P)H-binding protein [Brevibacillus choshinensis]|uniref:NAD(P)H-binding protein n=1 Tax=Brevibacillus choshinensis TaxID=54911 RepID=UPI002E1A41A6|nr:NAD(P)H-binding protein [Brevibacillus choshinensis]
MLIAITGANGKLGRLIIHQLLKKVPASQVVACVRNPQSMQEYKEIGVDVRYCDYDQPDSLDQALVGASHLLLISSSHQDEQTRFQQHSHVIEAAKKSNVGHFMYTSFAFLEKSSISLTHLHLATERAILSTGIPHTFFRNALYTDFVAAIDLQTAITKGILRVSPGDWMFNSVSRLDLALGIAAVLSEPDRHQHKSYELTSSHLWTFPQLTTALSELTSKPISLQEDPAMQHWIFGFLGKIQTSTISNDLEQLIGHPTTSLKESIRPFISTATLS